MSDQRRAVHAAHKPGFSGLLTAVSSVAPVRTFDSSGFTRRLLGQTLSSNLTLVGIISLPTPKKRWAVPAVWILNEERTPRSDSRFDPCPRPTGHAKNSAAVPRPRPQRKAGRRPGSGSAQRSRTGIFPWLAERSQLGNPFGGRSISWEHPSLANRRSSASAAL